MFWKKNTGTCFAVIHKFSLLIKAFKSVYEPGIRLDTSLIMTCVLSYCHSIDMNVLKNMK